MPQVIIDHDDAERLACSTASESNLARCYLDAAKRVEALEDALRQIMVEKIDYMTINNLGDPETQHTIKAARAALAL